MIEHLTEEQKAHVKLGGDAEDFVKSELGQVILGMAKQDWEAAIDEFNNADITNQAKLIELKVKIRAAKQFEQYLSEIVIRGREAWESRENP